MPDLPLGQVLRVSLLFSVYPCFWDIKVEGCCHERTKMDFREYRWVKMCRELCARRCEEFAKYLFQDALQN